VNKLFPHEDGGLSGPRATRYYAGDEVMVEVYYDQTGGNWKPENRVTDSPHIYRARQAMD
jgi:hypothetical protein